MRARGVASSSTHCGRKSSGAVRKDDEYCALSSSAAAAVAIGQLQLRLSHYSLVALYRLFASRNVTSRGPRGGLGKNFLGSLSLAIFSGPLMNYTIIRPLQTAIADFSPRFQSYSKLVVRSYRKKKK